MEKTKLTEKQAHRNLLIAISILNFSMVLLITFTSILLYSNQVRSSRRSTAEGAAKIAASIVDGDDIYHWLEYGKNIQYERNLKDLEGIKKYTPYLEYLYVYQIKPDGCHVIFDIDNDALPGEPLGTVVEFDESFKSHIDKLLRGERIDFIESKDKYGWLLTFYEPIYDSNNNVVAYAGADMSMIEIRNYINNFVLFVMTISGLFLILVIVASSKMSINYYNKDKMEKLLAQQQRDKHLLRELTESFAKVIDLKDHYTQGHSFRVANYTSLLAKELGYDDETVEKFYDIALLHDIGKVGIPEEILNKPTKLTEDEFEVIKSHTTRGYEVLKNISLLPEISVGALYHHERPDGLGYPKGLKEGEIPRIAQIIAVADTFDAMYSTRKYREKMQFDKVVSIIKDSAGTQLTPDVVDAFVRLVDKGEIHADKKDGKKDAKEVINIHEE